MNAFQNDIVTVHFCFGNRIYAGFFFVCLFVCFCLFFFFFFFFFFVCVCFFMLRHEMHGQQKLIESNQIME